MAWLRPSCSHAARLGLEVERAAFLFGIYVEEVIVALLDLLLVNRLHIEYLHRLLKRQITAVLYCLRRAHLK